ncbi:hypothetical protein PVK06_038922 [Gossypium arboreum]|uniref:Uncharacterized protein n=1 Tax=Gossypium arboreum TaxID=29729 RepID=A0ABR0N1H2_GOSAR|nr:hypothetical protein PVK06_038922 [Gossypium arboreum]
MCIAMAIIGYPREHRFVFITFFLYVIFNSAEDRICRETAGEGSVTRKEFNGRKIGGHEVTMASKNSGGKNGAESVSIGKSQHQPKNQVSGVNKLEAKTSNFAGLGTPRNGGNNVESEKLLEATKEIVKLMQEDYRGRPRRKPPINNHVPRH